jgi:hypothetical protein
MSKTGPELRSNGPITPYYWKVGRKMGDGFFEEIISEGEFLHTWFIKHGNKTSENIPVSEQITVHRVEAYFAQAKTLIEQSFGDDSKELHSWDAIDVAWNERFKESIARIVNNRDNASQRCVMGDKQRSQIKRFEETLILLKKMRIKKASSNNKIQNPHSQIADPWYKQTHIQWIVGIIVTIVGTIVAAMFQ